MSQKSINVNQIRGISASYEDMSASISDATSSVGDGSAALLEAGAKEIQEVSQGISEVVTGLRKYLNGVADAFEKADFAMAEGISGNNLTSKPANESSVSVHHTDAYKQLPN